VLSKVRRTTSAGPGVHRPQRAAPWRSRRASGPRPNGRAGLLCELAAYLLPPHAAAADDCSYDSGASISLPSNPCPRGRSRRRPTGGRSVYTNVLTPMLLPFRPVAGRLPSRRQAAERPFGDDKRKRTTSRQAAVTLVPLREVRGSCSRRRCADVPCGSTAFRTVPRLLVPCLFPRAFGACGQRGRTRNPCKSTDGRGGFRTCDLSPVCQGPLGIPTGGQLIPHACRDCWIDSARGVTGTPGSPYGLTSAALTAVPSQGGQFSTGARGSLFERP
jgi:hypothetical protein